MSKSVQPQPLIAVRDVQASSRWYATLLGGEYLGGEHGTVYDRVFCGGNLVLQLHSWDDEDHPNLIDADSAPNGHGVLLWFEVGAFDTAVERIRALGAEIIEELSFNLYAKHHEIWLRDPDGYVVVLAGQSESGGKEKG